MREKGPKKILNTKIDKMGKHKKHLQSIMFWVFDFFFILAPKVDNTNGHYKQITEYNKKNKWKKNIARFWLLEKKP